VVKTKNAGIMKVLYWLTVWLGWSIAVTGQTNKPVVSQARFSTGPLAWRGMPPEAVSPTPQSSVGPNAPPLKMEISQERIERAIERYQWMNGSSGFLGRQSESQFSSGMERLFRPEVIRIGKMKVSVSLITAIKRKNPLCLLHPVFLNINW
jgi:hypothetical protein